MYIIFIYVACMLQPNSMIASHKIILTRAIYCMGVVIEFFPCMGNE